MVGRGALELGLVDGFDSNQVQALKADIDEVGEVTGFNEKPSEDRRIRAYSTIPWPCWPCLTGTLIRPACPEGRRLATRNLLVAR